MTSFDPYHKWLGIPPKDQPPNHYRLLGISLYEEDLDVVEAAADRCMAFVQQCSLGEHIQESQQILNELSAARVCLLVPHTKKEYDEKLRALILYAQLEISISEIPPPEEEIIPREVTSGKVPLAPIAPLVDPEEPVVNRPATKISVNFPESRINPRQSKRKTSTEIPTHKTPTPLRVETVPSSKKKNDDLNKTNTVLPDRVTEEIPVQKQKSPFQQKDIPQTTSSEDQLSKTNPVIPEKKSDEKSGTTKIQNQFKDTNNLASEEGTEEISIPKRLLSSQKKKKSGSKKTKRQYQSTNDITANNDQTETPNPEETPPAEETSNTELPIQQFQPPQQVEAIPFALPDDNPEIESPHKPASKRTTSIAIAVGGLIIAACTMGYYYWGDSNTNQPSTLSTETITVPELDQIKKIINNKSARSALAASTTVNFIKSPLIDAIKFLSAYHHVEITVDRPALLQKGMSPNMPVTLKTADRSLLSVLTAITHSNDLSFELKNNRIVITASKD